MERMQGYGAARDRELRVFEPWLHGRVARALADRQRFVHYTAASAAMAMIRGGALWLRNTRCMNDASEVRRGLELLEVAWRGPDGARLTGFLDSVWPGFRAETADRLGAVAEAVAFETFIGCVSEHDAAEDGIGRLSMWRAYGDRVGVALVLSNAPLLGPGSDAHACYAGPVHYLAPEAFLARFGRYVDGLIAEADYLAGLGRARVGEALLHGYQYNALTTKHPGFAEEREWRMAFTPGLQPPLDLERAVEICRGEPQVIYKLPLMRRPGAEGASTALADILESLIIGPCDNPRSIRDAFVDLLGEAGVEGAAERVRMSEIPLR